MASDQYVLQGFPFDQVSACMPQTLLWPLIPASLQNFLGAHSVCCSFVFSQGYRDDPSCVNNSHHSYVEYIQIFATGEEVGREGGAPLTSKMGYPYFFRFCGDQKFILPRLERFPVSIAGLPLSIAQNGISKNAVTLQTGKILNGLPFQGRVSSFFLLALLYVSLSSPLTRIDNCLV